MQIHELNTFSGALDESVYFAVDNGANTTKLSFTDLMGGASLVPELVDNFNYASTGLSYDAYSIESGYYVNGGCFTDKYLVMAFHKTEYNDYIGVFDKDTLALTTDINPNPFKFASSQKIGDMTYNPNTEEVILTSKASSTLYALDAGDFSLKRTITLEVGVAEIAYDVITNCYVGIGSDGGSVAYIFDSGFNLVRSWSFTTNATRQTVHAYGGLIWNLGYYGSSSLLPMSGIVSVYDYYGGLHKEYILPTNIGEVEFHTVNPDNNCLYFGYTNNGQTSLYGTKYLNIFRGKDVVNTALGIKNTYDVNFEKSLRSSQYDIPFDTTKVSGAFYAFKSFNIVYCRLSLTLVNPSSGMTIATVPEFAGASVLSAVSLLTGSLNTAASKYYGAMVMVNTSGEVKLYGDPDAFVAGNRIYGQVIVNCKS